jgi:nitrite reductase/ring-hydroxylating ferredoxin subunit
VKLVARIPKTEVDAGDLVRVTYPPFDVVVMKVEDKYAALEDACNHAGASLSEGDVRGTCILCPMHGYKFDVFSGELVAPKGLCDDQRTFVVKDEGAELSIWDPFTLTLG